MFRRFDLGLVRLVPAAVAVLVFAQTATLPATQDAPLPSGRDILAKHVKANAQGVKLERPGIRVLSLSRFDRMSGARELLDRLFGPAG